MKKILLVILCIFPVSLAFTAGSAAPKPAAVPPQDALWNPYRITPRTGSSHIELADGWQLGWCDGEIAAVSELNTVTNWFSTKVPDTVQMALYHSGKFPHPYERLNSKQYAWVDEKVWYYRRTVDLPAQQDGKYVFLCFEGIDYFSRIWFNGILPGRHEGMFGGPQIEVSKNAKFGGKNEIIVEVKAGNYGTKSSFKPWGPNGTVVKPWVLSGGLGAEMFFPLGMWRNASIEIVSHDHMERPFLITKEASEKEAKLTLQAEVFVNAHSLQFLLHPWKNTQLTDASHGWKPPQQAEEKYAMHIQLCSKSNNGKTFDSTLHLQLSTGRNFIKQELIVPKPKLWWPNGLGQSDLYRVKMSLLVNDTVIDVIEFDYGIRTIRTIPTPGPRMGDRWADWQFVVNGRQFFVKGINWMPADILLDLPRERYRWLLGAAKAAGIQLIRVWGGGLIETEEFYETCNELGLMVWQDFPIGNRDTPEWPLDVWEPQVMQTIFRLRNHPSLALWCGGNEFNPYSLGNTATIGIIERCLADFDNTRPLRRTSPDAGSIHGYPDMDPTWYGQLFPLVPFISETGMHSIPDASSIRELVDPAELNKPLTGMTQKTFPPEHPELMHHFVEYNPARVPRMLSRASHIDDMSAPMLESLSEATQIGAGEFYQILSDQVQANYPRTAGLMPWVFKRPWPVIAIMLVDGLGHPTAPYYFLKRTYEPTHVLVKLPHLIWARNEEIPLSVHVTHADAEGMKKLLASVEIFDPEMTSVWKKTQKINLKPGPSVTNLEFGSFKLPENFEDKFFFIVCELRRPNQDLVSRSVYWPRCLSKMNDPAFRDKYRQSPQPTLTLEKGPWLKPQTAMQPTSLDLAILKQKLLDRDHCQLTVQVSNKGPKPAFMTRVDVEGAKRVFYANDNFFWLAPGETRELQVEIMWRNIAELTGCQPVVSLTSWNSKGVRKTF
ncbi:MAG: hypothetical protein A2283_13680 [Lentisphaerae bacterium RIFOXYA12_FULL_48_11]|nr:MAG: hypothetical protein A2283_13680 [Lentisphaerae bacterium RIFOXYA12_FULL_48_11]